MMLSLLINFADMNTKLKDLQYGLLSRITTTTTCFQRMLTITISRTANSDESLKPMQGLSVPFACVGSSDPVRVLHLYTTNTLDVF